MEIALCRNCGAQITWLKSRQGNNVPVDISSITSANIKATMYQKGAFVCHFDTCANKQPRADAPVQQPAAQPSATRMPPSLKQEFDEMERNRKHGMAKSGERDDPEPPPITDDDIDTPF